MSITGSEQWMYSSGREFYDFPIEQSLRFNDNDSAYLSWTPSSTGNRKTWTWSAWVKRSNIGTRQTLFSTGLSGTAYHYWYFETDDTLRYAVHTGGSRYTSAVFRDTSAWMNIIIVHDTTDSTASDRIKIYVNGDRVTSFTQAIDPALNSDGVINSTTYPYNVGRSAFHNSNYYDGYMADINFIDGQALEPTSFGEFKSGIWTPVDTSGLTFGTNGFRLQFGDTTEASGFNTVTYTGNGGAQSISGTGFSSAPDLVWIKNRSSATEHVLHDSVRGAANLLQSNSTAAELNRPTYLTSFDSDGFSFGDNVSNYNTSGSNYVAWTWDAGSGSAASNTDGSITSTVKANTDYGFSIVSYTGTGANATVGHGLTSAPDMIIAKRRNTTGSWGVYHSGMTSATYQMWLNLTNGETSRPAQWNSTAPTSSVFSVGTDTDVNANGSDYIAYCFAEKTGYSSIGSYTGTGAAGNSINLGFKPAFLLIKETGNANSWELFDNTRNTSSPFDKRLFPNSNQAEATTTSLSYSDTGFETLNGNTGINRSGGTYIYMAFADTRNAAFWKDTSGEGNDWQPNNLVFSDVVPDSTTNNFANLMIHNYPAGNSNAFSQGNLRFTPGSGDSARNTNRMAISNMLVSSGKWYAEAYIVDNGSAQFIGVGPKQTVSPTANNTRYAYIYSADGNSYVRTGASESISTYASSYTVGDVIGIYVDMDAATPVVYFSKNGQWSNGSGSWNQSSPSGGITLGDTFFTESADFSGTFTFQAARASGAVSPTTIWNFGQDDTFAGAITAGGNTDANGYGSFKYAPPTNALALCSANLPSGAIDTLNDETPEDYFNTVIYTGDNTSSQSVTGVGFQPSLVWAKSRPANSGQNFVDAVRGATKNLQSNTTNAEATVNTVTSFDSDGFTVGDGNGYDINKSGESIVAWNWKAGGSGVSNTDGSITSTVSVGATSQQNWFSIATYTGTGSLGTVGHGLGVAPDMVIIKNRSGSPVPNWVIGNSASGWTGQLYFDTGAFSTNSGSFNNTAPTDSVVTINTDSTVNYNTGTYVMYSFANAEGLCKVGSYVGNGSTDGTFVYTGFRPAFVMVKSYTAGEHWNIPVFTSSTNGTMNTLSPNLSNAERTMDQNPAVDFVSNGFKIKTSDANYNSNGGGYIFLAIAEQPFKYANAR